VQLCVQKAGKTPLLPGGETSAGYIINKEMILKYITELYFIYRHKGIIFESFNSKILLG
jgi:hypothetical protein